MHACVYKLCACLCVCVCVRARARVWVCVLACVFCDGLFCFDTHNINHKANTSSQVDMVKNDPHIFLEKTCNNKATNDTYQWIHATCNMVGVFYNRPSTIHRAIHGPVHDHGQCSQETRCLVVLSCSCNIHCALHKRWKN